MRLQKLHVVDIAVLTAQLSQVGSRGVPVQVPDEDLIRVIKLPSSLPIVDHHAVPGEHPALLVPVAGADFHEHAALPNLPKRGSRRKRRPENKGA
jgi:hypothetical protein